MPETQVPQEDDLEMDPVLLEDDTSESDQIDEDRLEPATARRGPGRPRGRKTQHRTAAPAPAPAVAPGEPHTPDAEISGREAAIVDYESWLQKWGDFSLYRTKLRRIAPAAYKGVRIAGFLEQKEGEAYSEEEIKGTYGGGTYDVSVIGSDRSGTIRQLGHKQVTIAGAPRLTPTTPVDDDDEDDEYGPPSYMAARRRGGSRLPAYASHYPGSPSTTGDPVMGKALDIMQSELRARRDGSHEDVTHLKSLGLLKDGLQDAATRREDAANTLLQENARVVQEHKILAERQIQEARDRVAEARGERERLVEEARKETERYRDEKERTLQELRDIEARAAADRDALRQEAQQRIEEARRGGHDLLSTLLPQTMQTAQMQLDAAIRSHEARMSEMEQRHNSQVAALTQSYEARLKAQEDLFRIQFTLQQQTTQGQINYQTNAADSRIKQLEIDLQFARNEITRLTNILEESRKSLIDELQKAAKGNDPTEQLTKMGGILDIITGIKDALGGGAGGGSGEVGDGIDSPAFRTVAQLVNKGIEAIPNITEAIIATRRGNQQQMQMMPPGFVPPGVAPEYPQQLPPPQQQQLPQAMQGPPQQRVVKRPPQQASTAAPRPRKVKIEKEDLQTAINYVNGALGQATPPAPEDFARSAVSMVSNDVLRELARRPSELVLNELEAHGILVGRASSVEGREYVAAVLQALKPLVL